MLNKILIASLKKLNSSEKRFKSYSIFNSLIKVDKKHLGKFDFFCKTTHAINIIPSPKQNMEKYLLILHFMLILFSL
jgi:hypothetical protein